MITVENRYSNLMFKREFRNVSRLCIAIFFLIPTRYIFIILVKPFKSTQLELSLQILNWLI